MQANPNDKILAAAMRRLELLRRDEAFDPFNPDSRPTKAQQELIDEFGRIKIQWIVAANQSGKSQTCSRLFTWVLTETHPSWKRPQSWGNEPLKLLMAGRTSKIIEEVIVPKLESYLTPGTYKVIRVGNMTQAIQHENGNRIAFQSLENPTAARERLQGYVAHIVWVDEMPPTASILEELMIRIPSRGGYFLASFTPLSVNEAIRKMVDSATLPFAKKYKFLMFDNPLYATAEKQAEVLRSMGTMTDSVKNTRLYGEWAQADDTVYFFDYDKMVELPVGYSPLWRHVESVDPALSSALGLTIWAENPNTNVWYCIHSEYVKNRIPTELIRVVQERTKHLNVIRRISDPSANWYINEAVHRGINYIGVYKKHDRKAELIKNLQEKLSNGSVRLSPICTDLHTELQDCRWSSQSDGRIINSSSYHLLDSAQYFCDNIPKAEKKIISTSWQDWLYQANEVRKVNVEKRRNKTERIQIRRARGR